MQYESHIASLIRPGASASHCTKSPILDVNRLNNDISTKMGNHLLYDYSYTA